METVLVEWKEPRLLVCPPTETAEAFQMLPGVNKLPVNYWKAIRGNLTIARCLASGNLVEHGTPVVPVPAPAPAPARNAAPVVPVPAPAPAPAPARNAAPVDDTEEFLKDASAAPLTELIPVIEALDDLPLLRALRARDNREAVKLAVMSRVEVLENQ